MKFSFGFRISDLGLSIVESLLVVAVVVNVASTLSAQDHRGSGMELTSFEFDVVIVIRLQWSGQNRPLPRSQREPLAWSVRYEKIYWASWNLSYKRGILALPLASINAHAIRRIEWLLRGLNESTKL